jgi:hypothetical protein
MKTITRAQAPFSTSNAILAYCLHMAGVPWNDPAKPIKLIYSKEILNKFTNGSGEPVYKGWELEDAVRDAHKVGRRGHVEYMFERTPRLEVLLHAYQKQSKELDDSEGFAHDLVMRVSGNIGTAGWDVTMMKLACIFLKMRVPFMEKWQDMIPWVIIPNEGRVTRGRSTVETKHGDREAMTVSSPGWKMIPLNASKELREKFGLQ